MENSDYTNYATSSQQNIVNITFTEETTTKSTKRKRNTKDAERKNKFRSNLNDEQ